MTAFRHPAFAKLSPRIDRAVKEQRQIDAYLSSHTDEVAAGEWGAVSAVSLGIHNVYNGIEDILLSLANDADRLVPSGPSMHQDIGSDGGGNYGHPFSVTEFRSASFVGGVEGFRHLVRHRYGFDLPTDKV